MIRIAINGFGRIGRNVVRALYNSNHPELELVAINDLAPKETNIHLLKYDSVHGACPFAVEATEDGVKLAGKHAVKLFSERDPANLPWKELKVDVVLECTGVFTKKEKASAHLAAGARKVLISAPSDDADKTVVFGVNHSTLEKGDTVVSNASCTTNCLAPVAKILAELCGIERGLMTTIHAYTNDQSILDLAHKDLRRARAAAMSMIPTSTGAAKAVGLVLPQLKGKLDGFAVRVPTPNVSVVDLTFTPAKAATVEEINTAIQTAANSSLKGVLAYNTEPLVSIDFNGNTASSIFDATQTRVIDNGKLVKVLSWYDNETGFSYRMLDVATILGRL